MTSRRRWCRSAARSGLTGDPQRQATGRRRHALVARLAVAVAAAVAPAAADAAAASLVAA